jgi:hypothetical protein
MGARASSGSFVLQEPVGRSMEVSSGRYLTEVPVGRYHKVSSGHLCQVAPIGRLQTSNRRFNIKAPTGYFQKATSGCFLGRAASGNAVDLQNGSQWPAIMQRHHGLAVIIYHFMVSRV